MLAVRKWRKRGGVKRDGAELSRFGFQLIISNQRASESRRLRVFAGMFVHVRHDRHPLPPPQGFSVSLFVFGLSFPPVLFLGAGRAYIGFNIIFQSANAGGHGLLTPACCSV